MQLDPQPRQQTAGADQPVPDGDAGGGGQDPAETSPLEWTGATVEGRLIWVPQDTDAVIRYPHRGWGCTSM